jgi:cobalamin biosynthesis protein CbiM
MGRQPHPDGVLIVQALLFQDGGLMALGANVLNMAVVGVWTAYLTYRFLGRAIKGKYAMWIAGFAAAWLSVVLASAFALWSSASPAPSPSRGVPGHDSGTRPHRHRRGADHYRGGGLDRCQS